MTMSKREEIIIDGEPLPLEAFLAVARDRVPVKLSESPAFREHLRRSVVSLEKAINEGTPD